MSVFSRVCWKSRSGRAFLPNLDPMDTSSTEWNVPGKYGPHGELFFFLIHMKPAMVSGSENFSPFVNADICAEEGSDGEGCHAPGLGDEWEVGCPKSQMWEGGDGAWSEDESVSSSGSREGNVGNDALHVIGLYGPGDKISLFLVDCELAKVAFELPHGLEHAVPGNARGLVAGLPLPRGPLSQHEKPFSHRGRAVTKEVSDEPF